MPILTESSFYLFANLRYIMDLQEKLVEGVHQIFNSNFEQFQEKMTGYVCLTSFLTATACSNKKPLKDAYLAH
jgi:hypothetical protein